MDRVIEGRMHKLFNQNQEKENNSELLNNNLRHNYTSQPSVSSSLSFPSRGNITRLKDMPNAPNGYFDQKKKIPPCQPIIPTESIRFKASLDNVQKYKNIAPNEAINRV
jgi:hypothetical protein